MYKDLESYRCERSFVRHRRRKVPRYLRNRLEGLDGLFRHLRRAVRDIWSNRNGDGRADVLSRLCDEYGEDAGFAAARAAMHLARSRLEYWGIENPDEERWCSRCREVKPVEEFNEDKSEYYCENCYERRRWQDRTRDERDAVKRTRYHEQEVV